MKWNVAGVKEPWLSSLAGQWGRKEQPPFATPGCHTHSPPCALPNSWLAGHKGDSMCDSLAQLGYLPLPSPLFGSNTWQRVGGRQRAPHDMGYPNFRGHCLHAQSYRHGPRGDPPASHLAPSLATATFLFLTCRPYNRHGQASSGPGTVSLRSPFYTVSMHWSHFWEYRMWVHHLQELHLTSKVSLSVKSHTSFQLSAGNPKPFRSFSDALAVLFQAALNLYFGEREVEKKGNNNYYNCWAWQVGSRPIPLFVGLDKIGLNCVPSWLFQEMNSHIHWLPFLLYVSKLLNCPFSV